MGDLLQQLELLADSCARGAFEARWKWLGWPWQPADTTQTQIPVISADSSTESHPAGPCQQGSACFGGGGDVQPKNPQGAGHC